MNRALRDFYFRPQKKGRTNDKPNLTSIYYHLFSWITISGDDTKKIVTLTFSSSIYLLSIYARLRAWFAILWKKLSLFSPRIIYLPSFFACVHPFLRFTNENGISIINISTLHAGRDCINGSPSCEKSWAYFGIPHELFISPVFIMRLSVFAFYEALIQCKRFI